MFGKGSEYDCNLKEIPYNYWTVWGETVSQNQSSLINFNLHHEFFLNSASYSATLIWRFNPPHATGLFLENL